MKNISGIYKITNTKNMKVYIGSAIDISARWYRHKLHLRRGIHNCKPLQLSWDKHGADTFVFSMLEIVESKNELLAREQFYLDLIRPFEKGIGYNCCPTAYSTLGIKYSEEAKAKLSKIRKEAHAKGCYLKKNAEQKGRIFSEEHKAKIVTSLNELYKNGYVHSAERNAKIAASRLVKKYPRLTGI